MLCVSGRLGIHCVVEAGFKVMAIPIPKFRNYRLATPRSAHLFLQMSLKFEFFRRHKLERAMACKRVPSYIGTESCLETPELSKLDALSAFTLGSASNFRDGMNMFYKLRETTSQSFNFPSRAVFLGQFHLSTFLP